MICPDPHPLTHWNHPTTHTSTHAWEVSTNHKSSNKMELSWLGQNLNFFLAIWPDPTHPPTQPPNYKPTHGWGILHRFQIFKQNEIILISSSVIEFLLILRLTPGGDRWVDMWGCPMYFAHAYMYACTHTCTCMLNMINMDASMLAAICNFYKCIHVPVCMYMHAHACAYVWGHTPIPPDAPIPTCPLPRAAGSPKHQNSISLN